MSRTHHLHLPVTRDDVAVLRAGDTVYLHGDIVLAAGVLTHQRIVEYLEAGRDFPIPLAGGTLFNIAGYSRENGEVLYINPTTSTRFNEFMPRIIRGLDLRLTGGKGGLDAECARAMQETGCAYLSFLGGGSTLLTRSLKQVLSVNWTDLIFHYRLVHVRVEALGPATVGIDCHGASLYDKLTDEALARLPDILAGLGPRRAGAA